MPDLPLPCVWQMELATSCGTDSALSLRPKAPLFDRCGILEDQPAVPDASDEVCLTIGETTPPERNGGFVSDAAWCDTQVQESALRFSRIRRFEMGRPQIKPELCRLRLVTVLYCGRQTPKVHRS